MPPTKTIVACALLACFSAACSVQKTADQMKSTTEQIDRSSKHLAKRTDDLEYGMAKLAADDKLTRVLDQLFAQGVNAGSSGLGRLAYDYFFAPNEEPSMLADVGTAMHAMYFQSWKADYGERRLEELDERFRLSLDVLFARLLVHIPMDYEVDVTRPDRSYKGIASLAVKMEEMDLHYRRTLRRHDLPELSLYYVLTHAFTDRAALGAMLPKTVELVHARRREVIYLLQLRHNLRPMLVVARATDFKDRGDLGRLWMYWRGEDASVTGLEKEEFNEWSGWLEQAARTREDLRAMGVEPRYNAIFAGIQAGLSFVGDAGVAPEAVMSDGELGAAYQRFFDLYSANLRQMQPAPAPVAEEPAVDDPAATAPVM